MKRANTPPRVLAIVAHPDDEVLGCGGTLCLHRKAGHHVSVLIAAGRSAKESGYGVAQSSFTRQALAALGVEHFKLLGLKDQAMDAQPLKRIINHLEQAVAQERPNVVYCQCGGDVNEDHNVLFKAALVATRPTLDFIEAVYAFETASSTEWGYPRSFVPDTWVDISSVLDRKLAAMACYRPELRDYPHPRSLKGIDIRAKAFGNQCCLKASEVFMTIRRIYCRGQAPV
jgi:LmbE family N-acetylglucosaminyl deacetylase